ncbi:hypothetical protein, partial [Escherichia coli]|uniref:hypothetical protein n=1 Tax=Escherichia coli TaxID=562 RepID=UPI00195A72B3
MNVNVTDPESPSFFNFLITSYSLIGAYIQSESKATKEGQRKSVEARDGHGICYIMRLSDCSLG